MYMYNLYPVGAIHESPKRGWISRNPTAVHIA